MLVNTTKEELIEIISREHKAWAKSAVELKAEKAIESLDERFDECLKAYFLNGTEINLKVGEFCLLDVMALAKCGYYDSIILMNEYIDNPVRGRAKIFRKGF